MFCPLELRSASSTETPLLEYQSHGNGKRSCSLHKLFLFMLKSSLPWLGNNCSEECSEVKKQFWRNIYLLCFTSFSSPQLDLQVSCPVFLIIIRKEVSFLPCKVSSLVSSCLRMIELFIALWDCISFTVENLLSCRCYVLSHCFGSLDILSSSWCVLLYHRPFSFRFLTLIFHRKGHARHGRAYYTNFTDPGDSGVDVLSTVDVLDGVFAKEEKYKVSDIEGSNEVWFCS